MGSPSQLQHVVFFGDQTVDALPCLKSLHAQSQRLPTLRRFLRDAADVVQSLLTDLSLEGHEQYSQFESIVELADIYSKQDGTHETIGCVLWTTSQLADLIMQVELDPSILTQTLPHDRQACIVGICGGLLPAAAYATARNLNDLVGLSRKIVGISFRLGLAQWRRALDIESKPGRWATAIVNVAPKQIKTIIEAFNEDMAIPRHRQVYISFLAKGWAAVSGPPSLMPELWAYSSTLESASKMPLPLGTPAHAEHLPPLDFEELVGESKLFSSRLVEGLDVISTSTCKPFETADVGSLLRESLRDITGRTLNIAGVTDHVISRLDTQIPVRISSYGPPSQIGSFQKSLEEAGLKVEVVMGTSAAAGEDFGFDHLESSTTRDGSNLIAVVGQSARFPGSHDVETFWESLRDGKKFETEIPKSRFDLAHHFDATGAKKGSVTTRYGSFLDDPGHFDNRLFNVSPREAKQMDPVQRILMMCSYEALQTAGYSPDASLSTNRMRIATYFGQSGDDWRQVRASQDVDIYYIPGTVRSFAPGRLNYHYKWGGGNYAVDSACAASTTSVMLACNALLARECDTALAGGGQLNAAPEPYAGLSRAGFLSKTPGGCKTFRKDADGYCRGEGVGVVVLKRLEDALADKDNIIAVIRGVGRNYCWNSSSITHPSAAAQSKLVRDVFRNSGVDPSEVGFVEMHGTGTQAGDAVEMETITTVFGSRPEDNPLYIGAVKANIGHGEAAAGVASLIKATEMLRHGTIPPQPGFPGPRDPKFSHLDDMNIRIPDKAIISSSSASSTGGRAVKKILVNNFDASGGNNCVLLEAPPPTLSSSTDGVDSADPRGHYTVTVTARTPTSLQKNISNLHSYLRAHPDLPIASIAYTTTARRIQEDLRRAYTAPDTATLLSLLERDSTQQPKRNSLLLRTSAIPRSVVFTFTGQGAQYWGMGRRLVATSDPFRKLVRGFCRLGEWHGFPSVRGVFFETAASKSESESVSESESGEEDEEEDEEEKNIIMEDAVAVQLATVILEMSLADFWRGELGVEPDVVVGYSLGEYAALYVSGVLSAHDVLYLVGKRAELMVERCERGAYGMLAVPLAADDLIEGFLGEGETYPGCEVACKSAPKSTVVSGLVEQVERLREDLKAKGISQTTMLDVPYGFHCGQVEPILDDFGDVCEGVSFNEPRIPIVSSLDGVVVRDSEVFGPAYLIRQSREPVDFVGAMRACQDEQLVDGSSLWIEMGPRRVLSNLVKTTLSVEPGKLLHVIDAKEDNWKTMSTAMSVAYEQGLPIRWPKFHRSYNQHVRLLDLPTYAFDMKDFWIPPVAPVQAIAPIVAPSSAVPAAPVIPPVPGFPSASLQKVVSEKIKGESAEVCFESTLAHQALLSVTKGHRVNGVDIFPASGFMDMAYGAATYIHHRTASSSSSRKQPVPVMRMAGLVLNHALTLTSRPDEQIVVVKARKSSRSSVVEITFTSRDSQAEHEHGSCQLEYSQKSTWEAEWSQTEHFINAARRNVMNSSTGHKLQSSIVYRLFSNLVEYSRGYQAMQDVCTGDFKKEAVANLRLPQTSGDFCLNPYWADSLIHVTGFILNGNPDVPRDTHFLFNSLEDFRFSSDMQPGKTYSSYLYIKDDITGKSVHGDVYIFEDDKIVGMARGVTFMRLTRRVLDVILGKSSATTSTAAAATTTSHGHGKKTSPPTQITLPAPKMTSRQASTTTGSSKAQKAISIVMAKARADPNRTTDLTTLAEMGLDSLQWIELMAEIKRSLGLEIPAGFFYEHPEIGNLRKAIAKLDSSWVEDKGILTPPSTTGMNTPMSNASGPILEMSASSSSSPSSSADAILEIVLSQTGFDAADVTPSTGFDDMGLDSLCTIEVVGIVRERTGLDLPAAFFNLHPTVADMKRALGGQQQQQKQQQSPRSHRVVIDEEPAVVIQPPAKYQRGPESSKTAEAVLEIVLAQTGFEEADVTPLTRFDDMGLDSLCTIEVVSIVREKTGLDLPAAFFNLHPTVSDVRKALGSSNSSSSSSSSASNMAEFDSSISGTSDTGDDDDEDEEDYIEIPRSINNNSSSGETTALTTPSLLPEVDADLSKYSCDFFLMQGSSDSTGTPLFFLPDGTGYPAVLLKLPSVFSGDNPLFTCKSPLLAAAVGRELPCTVEGLAQAYASALRRTRPHGPYLLAGYSLGAAYAYEVAKILADAGEVVEGLFVVDFNMAASVGDEQRSRNPVPVDLSVGVMEKTGWMSGINNDDKGFHIPPAPPNMKFHALSVFKSLTRYFPRPMTPEQRPRTTYLLWAGEGMQDLLGQKDAGFLPQYGIIDWQMGHRAEGNGPAGWERYVGPDVRCATLPCDHLSMMMDNKMVQKTCQVLRGFLQECLDA